MGDLIGVDHGFAGKAAESIVGKLSAKPQVPAYLAVIFPDGTGNNIVHTEDGHNIRENVGYGADAVDGLPGTSAESEPVAQIVAAHADI